HHIALFGDVDRLTEMFVRDITVGLDGTTAKAGIIKVATSLGHIPPAEEKVCRAAGRASRRTGTPISTHTDGGTMGPDQLRFFLEEGADPSKILIGHSDGNLRLDYHRSILRQGAGVSLDRVSGQAVISDNTRAQMIAQLVNEGFGRQIVISHDAQLHWMGRPGFNERDHTYIFREFVPMLRGAGLSEGAIQDILVENPRRYLTN
ncbi:MAG: phosphotriesterase-related protein, partial [Chloroflexi bacterium]|nr:phosphotriesterase-related protein [Chloroflexota bacterium]